MKNNLMMRLRNLGNHLHNKRVLQAGEGAFFVAYFPKNASDCDKRRCYLPCVYCLGYYSRSTLPAHANRCQLREHRTSDDNRKRNYVTQGRLLLASELNSTAKVRQLFSKMPEDWITCVVKGDHLINKLALLVCLVHESNKKKQADIRRSLRLAAKLLIELRKLVPGVTALEDFITPEHFTNFIEAAFNVARSNETHKSLSETRISKIGWLLRKMAIMVQLDNIQNFSSEKRSKAIAFEELVLKEWKVSSVTQAITSRSARRQVVTLLSVSEDVKVLSNYLKERIRWHSNYLREDSGDSSHYNLLQSALLAFIILFNMKRGGVVSNMTIREFQKEHASSLWNRLRLSKFEQDLIGHLRFVEVGGRRERVFPIFITEIMRQTLELLIDCRKPVGLSKTNQNVFVNSEGVSLLGYHALKEACEKCRAKRPDVLWAPELRKHVMTMTQLFNFKNQELEALAGYLKIDISDHNKYYKLPQEPLQVARVTKIISLKEKGEFQNPSRKSLEELNVNLEEEVEGKNLISISKIQMCVQTYVFALHCFIVIYVYLLLLCMVRTCSVLQIF